VGNYFLISSTWTWARISKAREEYLAVKLSKTVCLGTGRTEKIRPWLEAGMDSGLSI
jgi:hypothetical protein